MFAKETPGPRRLPRGIGTFTLIAVTLLLTAIYALLYSHAKLLWNDEILLRYTVDQLRLGDMLRFQTSTPVVFDPPGFEILAWVSCHLFGVADLALRLPSILLFMVTQAFLFLLVRPFGGPRAAWLAMLLPLPLTLFDYGVEARPYALFLCAGTAAVAAWWRAGQLQGWSRRLWLCMLFLAVAAATTCQFYGVLTVVPPVVGQVVRSLRGRRRMDWALWGVLVAGCCAVLLDVPSLHAVAQYHVHTVRPADFTIPSATLGTFTWMMKSDTSHGPVLGLLLLVALLSTLPVSFFRMRRLGEGDGTAAWAALAALTLLELPIVVVAYFVTYTYAPRHAIPAFAGFLVLLCIALGGAVQQLSVRTWRIAAVVVVAVIGARCAVNLRTLARKQGEAIASIQAPPEVLGYLLAHPQDHAYMTVEECLLYAAHGDPVLDKQIRCLVSEQREVLYNKQIISSASGMAMDKLPRYPLRTAPYEQMRSEAPVYASLLGIPFVTWIEQSVRADEGTIVPVGQGFGGEVDRVSFDPGRPGSGKDRK